MAKKKKDSGAKATDPTSPKSKSSKQASSKKAKGPSVDELLVVVADTAKEAVRAGVKAQEAANKTSAKKGALKEARARAAQAKLQAARTADELAVAEAAARTAEHAEREATKALAKAKKKRADAESAASKAVDKAGKARAVLESLPAAASEPGQTEEAQKPDKSAKSKDKKSDVDGAVDAKQSAEVDALIGETLVQDAELSDASPESVPSELVEVETEYEALAPVTDVADPAELAPSTLTLGESASTASDAPADDWTLARLRVIARERGVRGYSAMSKARLLEVLLTEDSGAPTLGI